MKSHEKTRKDEKIGIFARIPQLDLFLATSLDTFKQIVKKFRHNSYLNNASSSGVWGLVFPKFTVCNISLGENWNSIQLASRVNFRFQLTADETDN